MEREDDMTLSFSHDKARAIVALPMGAEFETRRKMKFPYASNEAGCWGFLRMDEHQGRFGAWFQCPYGGPIHFVPRYYPGRVYPLGFPHQVWHDGQVYIPCQERIVFKDGDTHIGCKEVGWHTAMRAGWVLPAYAYTHWVEVVSAEPQRLGDVTEAQAKAELVEHHSDPAIALWRDYTDRDGGYACRTAWRSYLTLIDSIHGPGTAARNEWFWRYCLRRVPKPQAKKGANQ